MAVILEEHWHTSASTLQVECKGFKCPKMPWHAVAGACYTMRQIFLKLNLFWRQPAKPEAFRFYICPSSTMNSILLNSVGAPQKEFIDNVPSHPKRPLGVQHSYGARL